MADARIILTVDGWRLEVQRGNGDRPLTVDLSDATDRQPRQRIVVPAELADGFERAVVLANLQAR